LEISLINTATSANNQPSVLIGSVAILLLLVGRLKVINDSPILVPYLVEVNGAALNSYSTQALTNTTINTIVQDYQQVFSGTVQNSNYALTFVYSWEVLSATCGSINLSSANTQNSTLLFLAISSSTIRLSLSLLC
jgi:hypothetical protein